MKMIQLSGTEAPTVEFNCRVKQELQMSHLCLQLRYGTILVKSFSLFATFLLNYFKWE